MPLQDWCPATATPRGRRQTFFAELSCRPIGSQPGPTSKHQQVCVCTKRERRSRQRPAQTRKTALLCSEPTAGHSPSAALPCRSEESLPRPQCGHSPASPLRLPSLPSRCLRSGGRSPPGGWSVKPRGSRGLCARRCVGPASQRSCSALLSRPMEGADPSSPGEELELSVLHEPLEEQRPLNGALQVLPASADDPSPAQVRSL